MFCLQLSAKPALHSVPDVNWEPYWIIQGPTGNGILGNLMQHLVQQPGLQLKASNPFPVKRVQLMFAHGELVVECCVNPAWRPAQDNQGKSLWSDVVMTTHEVLVFPKGKEFTASSSKDLAGKQVATILGYGYANDDLYTRNDVLNNIAQLKLVAFERTDVGIFDIHELKYLLSSVAQAKTLSDKISLGPKIGSSKLRMRVHSSRPDLLEKLNKHIRRAKEDGTLAKILEQYVGTANPN